MRAIKFFYKCLVFLFCVHSQHLLAQEYDKSEYLPDTTNQFVQKYLNKKLEAFQLVDLEGNIISSENLEGKFVHIYFWSTTCKPCIKSFTDLDSLKAKYQNKNVEFIAIAAESEKKVKKVFNKFPLSYTKIADAQNIFDKLGVDGYPKSFLLDEKGKIVYVKDGSHMKAIFERGKLKSSSDNFRFYDYALSQILK